MIAFIARLLGVNTLAASLIVYGGAAALVGGSLWGYGLHKYNSGYSAGEAHEKADWEDRQRLARIAAEADARVKQAAIDAAAQALADQADADTLRIADLEDRIRQQKDEDNGPNAAGDTAGACKPGRGIPARLSIGIDAVGR
jgi:hypothetical protein